MAKKKPTFACRAAPAPGYRDAGYYKGFGALRDVGHYGCSWSSTVSGSSVRCLDFRPTWLTPQNSNYRAYGFQLRCLQEREAPGYRASSSGRLHGVGSNGYSWASSVATGSRSYRLFFYFGELIPNDHGSCANGFQLRCLQEEGGGRAADFTLEPGGLSVRENLLRLACGAVELWGLNESLTSSPLRPRWPLLFGIIQKVGKKIIQEGLTSPLEIPRPTFKYDLNRISRPAPGCRSALEPHPQGVLLGFSRPSGTPAGIWSSSFPSGSDNARYWHFNYNFLARQAGKTPGGRGFPLRCLREREEDENRRV